MMDLRNLSFPIARRRSLLALLAALALALGMVAPHDLAVEQMGRVSQVEIAEAAVHPHAPPHFEDAELKTHPACVGCLLQLGSRTVLSRPRVPPRPMVLAGNTTPYVALFSAARPSLFGPSRAPPSSFLSA
jgi:hypothetical protein